MHATLRSLLAALVLLIPGNGESRLQDSPPHIVLWAWERPEDLRFLKDQQVGVAFLATTLRLQGRKVVESPRRQPLRVGDTTHLSAVVRIEADDRAPLDAEQQRAVLERVLAAAKLPGVRMVQVDFDARQSQRPQYASLLRLLRAALPVDIKLSMTALASWCVFDRWIDGKDLPVDEVVPMVFAMGPGGTSLRARLDSEGDFRSSACRDAVGFATWEPAPSLPSNRRVYWFHDAPWTAVAVRKAIARTPR